MDDSISRQAAIDALDAICDRECEYTKKQRAVMCASCHLGSAFDVIDDLPSAERHGHWIENETSYADHPTKQTCNCSVCKRASTRPLGDWCRWCGAKMDEE